MLHAGAALALGPAGAVGLVARTCYAMGDFRTRVRVSTGMLVVNGVFAAARVVHGQLVAYSRAVALLAGIAAGVASYVLAARMLGVEELQPLLRRLTRRGAR